MGSDAPNWRKDSNTSRDSEKSDREGEKEVTLPAAQEGGGEKKTTVPDNLHFIEEGKEKGLTQQEVVGDKKTGRTNNINQAVMEIGNNINPMAMAVDKEVKTKEGMQLVVVADGCHGKSVVTGEEPKTKLKKFKKHTREEKGDRQEVALVQIGMKRGSEDMDIDNPIKAKKAREVTEMKKQTNDINTELPGQLCESQ